MEENNMVETVETQPQVEAEETASTEPETEVTEATAEDTTPAETDDTTAEETVNPDEEEPIITVKYLKEAKSLSKKDAVLYVQKGMRYDSLAPMLESLKYVAAAEGKTLVEFVQAIRDQHDENAMAALVDRCGGNEEIARELFEVEKGKHQAAYENLLKAEQDAETETEEAVTRRLADELAAVREEFPEVTEYSKLPKSVVREADEKNIPLLDAYLRFLHREHKKSEVAKSQQAAAAKASVGAQASTEGNETRDPVIAAMMKGIWG